MQTELQALEALGPGDYAELMETAQESMDQRQYQQAFGHYMLAIKADPSKREAKEKFVELSYSCAVYTYNSFIENAALKCLEVQDLDCSALRGVWYTLFVHHPEFGKFFNKKYHFEKHVLRARMNIEMFAVPFFLTGLLKLHIYNCPFEKLLMELRKMLLEDVEKKSFAPEMRLAVASALACYCFHTEYVFETDEGEDGGVKALRAALDAASVPDAFDAAVFACYEPLHILKSAARVADAFREHPHLGEAVRRQIDLKTMLADAEKSIVPLTEVDDAVSKKVRGQYEVFPYPRWRHILKPHLDARFADRLKKPGLKVLVAGCGTGHEPAMMSLMMPEARILAVDLSRASLSYAIAKTGELGFKNIEFKQGDILKLGGLPDKYDFISSGGVLHHLQEPLRGWKVLTGLLKEDGLMRIGLYSKTARRFILQAQDFIKRADYGSDADGMRRFRSEAQDVLKKEVYEGICKTADFYSLSMLRDLLFHVQEHDFDIPEIARCLDELGLEFVKFHLSDLSVFERFRQEFPQDPDCARLENWHLFEQRYPDTFKAMYQFYLRKK